MEWPVKTTKWRKVSGYRGRSASDSQDSFIVKAYQKTAGTSKNSGGVGRPGRRKRRMWNIAPKNR